MTRGLFSGSKGGFTSFFTRTGYGGGSPGGGEASIHGGAAGGFRQVASSSPPHDGPPLRQPAWLPGCLILQLLHCAPLPTLPPSLCPLVAG